MIKKHIAAILLFALLILPCAKVYASEAGAEPAADSTNVLLVAQTSASGQEIMRIISACGKSADFIIEADYTDGLAKKYDYVVTDCPAPVQNALENSIPLMLIGESTSLYNEISTGVMNSVSVVTSGNGYASASTYEDKIFYIKEHNGKSYDEIEIQGISYPFSVQSNNVCCVPYYRPNELSAILLGAAMQRFFGQPQQGKMYLIIDEVYAFTDLHSLCLAADFLYENALPFIVRVMPLYENLDYPAFLRFTQVLRYMQAKNGTIVLSDPLVYEFGLEQEPLENKMQRFYDALDSENIAYVDMQYTPYTIDTDLLYAIQPDSKNFGTLPIDTMVVFPLHSDEESLNGEIEKINRLWLSVESYRRNFTNANYQYHEISIDEQYEYVVEEEQLLARQFAVGNEVLVALVALFLLILTGLILIGARINRLKFKKRG